MVLGSEGRLGIVTSATVHVHRLPARARDPRLPASRPGRPRSPRCATSPPARRRRRSRACPIRRRRSSRSRRKKRSSPRRRLKSQGADGVPRAPARVRPRRDVPRLHRLRGQRAPRRERSAGASADRRAATAACASAAARARCTTRRSSTRPTSATSCSTAACWPTCPRPRRRGARSPRSTRDVTAAARGAFAELGVSGYVMCHLSHSYHSGACLYFTFAITPSGRREPLEEYDVVKSAIQQAFVDDGRDAVAPPRGRHRACPLARAGHLRSRRRDAARRCSTASTPAATSTRARSSERLLPATARATIGLCTSKVPRGASSPSRYRGRRRRAGAVAGAAGARRSASPRRGRERAAARPESALRPADMVGRGRER